jgi:hypothetical protein
MSQPWSIFSLVPSPPVQKLRNFKQEALDVKLEEVFIINRIHIQNVRSRNDPPQNDQSHNVPSHNGRSRNDPVMKGPTSRNVQDHETTQIINLLIFFNGWRYLHYIWLHYCTVKLYFINLGEIWHLIWHCMLLMYVLLYRSNFPDFFSYL